MLYLAKIQMGRIEESKIKGECGDYIFDESLIVLSHKIVTVPFKVTRRFVAKWLSCCVASCGASSDKSLHAIVPLNYCHTSIKIAGTFLANRSHSFRKGQTRGNPATQSHGPDDGCGMDGLPKRQSYLHQEPVSTPTINMEVDNGNEDR